MRLKAKVDANQTVVVGAFRKLGWSVAMTHQLGKGFPDIIISRLLPSGLKFTAVIEIKDGSKPMSAQKLTPDEEKFAAMWQGEGAIIRSVDQVIEYNDHVMKEFG